MLRPNEYLKVVRRPYLPFYSSLIIEGWGAEERYRALLPRKFALRNNVILDHWWYYGLREVEECGRMTLDTWRDPEKFTAAKAEIEKREKALLQAAHGTFEQFCEAYKNYMPVMPVVPFVQEYVVAELMEKLMEKIASNEAATLVEGITIPLQDTYHIQEEEELLTASDLARHVHKFNWLISRYGSPEAYTLEEAKRRRSELKKHRHGTREKEKETVRAAISRAQAVLATADHVLIDIIQYITFYRTQRTDVINRAAFEAIPLLTEIADTKGILYDDALYCLESELNSTVPSPEILAARKSDHAILWEDGQVRCLSGEDIQPLYAYFHIRHDQAEEIKGMTACRGLVQGRAVVVRNLSDFAQVREGDIIVTPMTTPNMVPVLRLAAAFVTDEGGITCHAAIISREMGKPCVIGTKIGTEVLRTGQQVEVDADSGRVRVLTPS